MIKFKKGLDLPIKGKPEQTISLSKDPSTVALLGPDYVGMKPTMEVRVAEKVKLGQVLFTDKKNPALKYTSPGAGEIVSIHRGGKRALLSVVIKLSGNEEITFNSHSDQQLKDVTREQAVQQLLDSGLWISLRTRPFNKVPDPETKPNSIFITAMDTNPLAPSISKILEGQERDFANGAFIISLLTNKKVFICTAPGTEVPLIDRPNIVVEEFSGPHPAGNVGAHIHSLDPVSRKKTVWHIGLQDAIAIGKLFSTGKIHTERIISLGGPSVINPRLLKTRIGASTEEILGNELKDGENRVISGSVLSGFEASSSLGFLGRYHQQISVITEFRKRQFLGWLNPGLNHFSTKNILLSSLIPGKQFNFNTTTYGEERAILPSGGYEKVMPMDIESLALLRALAVNDLEDAEALGCLELDEEDLALCAFVCPSKLEFGPMLRRNLTMIEKEG
ncbi:MAG: Na(+)-translocating NADH-quinone reductase subunit A [Ignavibacteriaceae bacterium]|nr:Na(+)-translocating NADH-quinone reductase subunit A [Ignavibacteriaceae bacterium]